MRRARLPIQRKAQKAREPRSSRDVEQEPRLGAAPAELIDLLRIGDTGTRVRAAGELQRHAGNTVLRQVIQRAPTDAEIWEKDWTDNPSHRYRFKGSDRPSGDEHSRYTTLCPLYKAHGIPRPMEYVKTSITTGTFFGHSTPAHSGIATALSTAETTLRGKGVTTSPVTKLWAFNPRTTSEGNWSNHADGKAVDIDEHLNPRLSDVADRKIVSLVTGTDMTRSSQGFDALKAASDRFKADYNPTGMARRIGELKAAETTTTSERDAVKGERDGLKARQTTLQSERAGFAKELRSVKTGKKATPDDITKAAELKASIKQRDTDIATVKTDLKAKEAELKKKEAELKTATKDRELLESHLKSFEATDKAISDLQATVTSLPGEITTLEGQIAQTKTDEATARASKDTAGAKAQRNLRAGYQKTLNGKKAELVKSQKSLDKKTAARDAQDLRKYGAEGFVNIPKAVHDALTGAGLTWGGEWGEPSSKDFMHFQL
jgi:hypothetical protein